MSETKNVQVPFPMPEKLYKVIEGFFRSKALFAACEFGIFDKLRTASAQQSADEITKALSSDLDATTRLMDTLVAMEVLEKSKEGDQWLYSNSEMATKFLTKDSPDSYLDMIAPSRRIAIHDRRSGAVGTLAYAFCQHYPEMKITVCDLEPAVSLAHHFRPSVEACPNQANVSFAVGDFFKPETIPKADLYVLSHVLHDWSEDKVDLILSNVYKCLPSGGGLFICEQILDEDKSGPLHALIYSIYMLVLTGGKERSASEYKHLLEKHGFVDVQAKKVYFSKDAIFCRKM
ncbi:probable bifunctional dTTP/UTP pyrophosphatase/methyltransferase protein [Porites lutea]|uniref:probable bifunctional dTTP/UTP pyrophosphatase/methyltransferase protein n=1 Tax=Porites lutea TaxID=51062 RepID=UPI003CC62B54